MSAMSERDCHQKAPWLSAEGDQSTPTVTATVIEGAEVVRTAAVSYATPILHQVYIQGAPFSNTSSATCTATTSSSSNYRQFRLSVGQAGTQNSHLQKKDESLSVEKPKVNSSLLLTTSSAPSSPPSSVPLWVLSPSLLSSNSVILRPVSPTILRTPGETSLTGSSYTIFTSSPSPTSSSCSSSSGTRNDDELTSLTWLQDSNLLMGTALSPIKHPAKIAETAGGGEKKLSGNHKKNKPEEGNEPATKNTLSETIKLELDEEQLKVESPTSDYGDEAGEVAELSEGGISEHVQTSPIKPQPIPYNPQIHVKAKPPYSFSCLIFMAIEDSQSKALPVKDIYSWILDHYPYYRTAPTGWKNSVRHNLSLNKCFSKVEKAPNLGKGSLWMVDPTFRPNLLQAMSKTPFTPQSQLDRSYMLSSKTVVNTQYLYSLSSKSPDKVISSSDFLPQNEALSPTTSCLEIDINSETIKNDDTFHIVDNTPKQRVGEEQTTKKHSDEKQKANTRNSSTLYTPNPELFPRLAKRLESHSMEIGSYDPTHIDVQSEDVDAAAAMLVLKHGPRILSPYNDYRKCKEDHDNLFSFYHQSKKRNRKSNDLVDPNMMVISSSPSLDHAYVSLSSKKEHQKSSSLYLHRSLNEELKTKETTSPSSSVDEAFFDESFDGESHSESSPNAFQYPPMEEADALLNLAAVATSLASGNSFYRSSYDFLESHPSYCETQIKSQSGKNPKVVNKRKLLNGSKNPSSSKKTTKSYNSSGRDIQPTLDDESSGFVKSARVKALYNNNNNGVLNRNKLYKVKKVVKVHKS